MKDNTGKKSSRVNGFEPGFEMVLLAACNVTSVDLRLWCTGCWMKPMSAFVPMRRRKLEERSLMQNGFL